MGFGKNVLVLVMFYLLVGWAMAFGSDPNVDWLGRRLAVRHAGEPVLRLQQFLHVSSVLRHQNSLLMRAEVAGLSDAGSARVFLSRLAVLGLLNEIAGQLCVGRAGQHRTQSNSTDAAL